MSEVMVKCRCCGAELLFAEDETTRRCGFCRTINARPESRGEGLNILNRATEQRLAQDFFHAEESYRRVLELETDSHEARWGLVLCKYGVDYVRDPRSGKQMPVCHTVRVKPMREDADFKKAVAMAPEEIRASYEADAAYIDAAQQRIRDLQVNEPGYDIFLCYKETALTSNDTTEESRVARRLYNNLTRKGYRVFYAPESLSAMLGEDYEAGIYHAIETAKVMLVIGCNPAHLTSAWVQSEWSRFLERIDNGEGKHLVPIYGGMHAEKLPNSFRHRRLQGLSMDDLAWEDILDSALLRLIKKPAPEPEPEPQPLRQYREAVKPEPQPDPEPPKQPEREQPAPAALAAAPAEYTSEMAFLTRTLLKDRNCVIITRFVGTEKKIVIPPTIGGKRVTWFGEGGGFSPYVFLGKGPEEVILPDTLEVIGNKAFLGCKNLKSIDIPESVTAIGDYAFKGCSRLKSFTFPDNMVTFGSHIFGSSAPDVLYVKRGSLAEQYVRQYYPTKLRYKSQPQPPQPVQPAQPGTSPQPAPKPAANAASPVSPVAYTSEGSFMTQPYRNDPGSVVITRFTGKDKTIVIPPMIGGKRVVGIGHYNSFKARPVFQGSNPETVILPDTLELIGDYAFAGCSELKDIEIPETVKTIGLGSFSGCYGLKRFTFPDNVTKIGRIVFNEQWSPPAIYVKRGSYAEEYVRKNDPKKIQYK